MSKTEAKIVITNATELKPGSKYLVALDRNSCTIENAQLLLSGLKGMGVDNAVVFMTDGDPNQTLQVIEQGSE